IFPPTRHPAERCRPEITVSASRSPAAIAREISRRLLPRYRAILADAQARNRQDAADGEARSKLAAIIADLLPPGPAGQVIVRETSCSTELHLNTAAAWAEVRIDDAPAPVSVQLRDLPASAALAMLTAMAA